MALARFARRQSLKLTVASFGRRVTDWRFDMMTIECIGAVMD